MALSITHEFKIITKPQQGDNVEEYLKQRGLMQRRDTEKSLTVYPMDHNPFTLKDAQNLEQVVEQYSMYGLNKRIQSALTAAKPKNQPC